MIAVLPYGETVTRLRPALVDNPAGNDTIADWTAPEQVDFEGVAVGPGATFETPEPGRTPLSADFTLYGPPAWDITSQDRVSVRGAVCEVVGDPFDYKHPMTGWSPGTVVTVRKRER